MRTGPPSKRNLPSSNEGSRWGSGLGNAYAGGIRDSKKWAVQAARNTALAVAAILKTSSPPGPLSPLHLIDKWGRRTIEEYAGGMSAAGPGVKKAALAVAAGAASALRSQPGVSVPVNAFRAGHGGAPGRDRAARAGLAGAAGAAARRGYHPARRGRYPLPHSVNVSGALPVKSICDIDTEMRRLGQEGALPAPVATPQYRRRAVRMTAGAGSW